MGIRNADGIAMGHARKRGERATGGCAGRRERRPERPLRNSQRGGDAGPHEARQGQRDKNEAGRNWRGQNPWEWGETMGATRPLEWTPRPTDWGGRRGAARPPEWRKTPVGAAVEWAGELSGLRTTRLPER